ncbi:MAG: SRPBCC family protein [Chloroflexota bacterium]
MSASISPPTRGMDTARQVNIGETERRASVMGGAALLLWGLTRASVLRWPALLSSAYLIQRGITGWCSIYGAMGIERTGKDGQAGVRVERTLTVNQPREDVYNFWRNFENLPRFMKHLEDVQVIDKNHSHWTARAPLGATVDWQAEIIEDIPNEKISWQSLPGSRLANAGSVIFRDAPGGRGAEIQVTIQYDPPAGSAGAAVARLLGEEPAVQVEEDLRRFKQLMETGEVTSAIDRSRGRDKSETRTPGPHNAGMGLRTGEAAGHEDEATPEKSRQARFENPGIAGGQTGDLSGYGASGAGGASENGGGI